MRRAGFFPTEGNEGNEGFPAEVIDPSFARYLLFKILARRAVQLDGGQAPRASGVAARWLGRHRAPPSVALANAFPRPVGLAQNSNSIVTKENGRLFCDIRNNPFNPWSQKRGIGETARGRNGVTRDPRIVANFRGLVSVNL